MDDEECPSCGNDKRWKRRFKRGHTSLQDDLKKRRSSTGSTPAVEEKLKKIIEER